MRSILDKVSTVFCIAAGWCAGLYFFKYLEGLLFVTFAVIGLGLALGLDLTCPHQRRLYWDKKK